MTEPISDEEVESLRVLIAAGPLVDCTWEQGSVLNLAASFIARLDAAEAKADLFQQDREEVVNENSALKAENERLRVQLGDDCAVKHCGQDATLGMTIIESGLRVELYLCETHFDALAQPHD